MILLIEKKKSKLVDTKTEKSKADEETVAMTDGQNNQQGRKSGWEGWFFSNQKQDCKFNDF